MVGHISWYVVLSKTASVRGITVHDFIYNFIFVGMNSYSSV